MRRYELFALLPLLSGLGCADPSGRFQAFGDRRAALDNEGGAAATGAAGSGGVEQCMPPEPGVVHGPALLALETTTGPGLPILFLGEEPQWAHGMGLVCVLTAIVLGARGQGGATLPPGPVKEARH